MLQKVLLNSDVFSFCVAHALITEKEEIMGLLIGEKIDEGVYKICSALALKRSDKKSDRVEISPEQLSKATSHVESMSERLKKSLRIVGWYHSHPHITAMPSDVDIRTQASYQLLDSCFIGLILSVFNTSQSNQVNRIQMCCFQSYSTDNGLYERVDVDFELVSCHSMSAEVLECFRNLPDVFLHEEKDIYENFAESKQPFTSLHNKSVFIKNLIEIIESIHIPLVSYFGDKIERNKSKLKSIKEEKDRIKKELDSINRIKSCSRNSTNSFGENCNIKRKNDFGNIDRTDEKKFPPKSEFVPFQINPQKDSSKKPSQKFYGESSI